MLLQQLQQLGGQAVGLLRARRLQQQGRGLGQGQGHQGMARRRAFVGLALAVHRLGRARVHACTWGARARMVVVRARGRHVRACGMGLQACRENMQAGGMAGQAQRLQALLAIRSGGAVSRGGGGQGAWLRAAAAPCALRELGRAQEAPPWLCNRLLAVAPLCHTQAS